VAEKVIFALIIVALVVLYLTMRGSLEAPDPKRLPTETSIHAVIEGSGRKCDNVDSFRRLATENDWVYYLARCHDGGRYVYSQNSNEGKFDVMSCAEEEARGYTCPD